MKRNPKGKKRCVLVMDMPSGCIKCPLYDYVPSSCFLTNKFQNNISDDFKPDWCPLREFPKKKNSMNLNSIMEKCKDRDSIMDSILKQFIVDGYNACIDELLKGEEG